MVYKALSVILLYAIATLSGAAVYLGEPDKDQKYPYVVSFIRGHQRACTGTLISPNWVLTAGECTFYSDEHKVQYGNLSTSPSQAKQTSKVVKSVKHPSLHSTGDSTLIRSDLQLVMVETVPFKRYGNVSATDYKSFMGSVVEFASLEVTYRDIEPDPANIQEDNEARPLMLGQGLITACDSDNFAADGPLMCIAPTCEKRFKSSWAADSGGPLFSAGKVIGVLKGAGNLPSLEFTAVSPFVDWIHLVMTQNSLDDVI